MDEASKHVVRYLTVIEDVRAEFGRFVDEMRGRPAVVYAKPFVILAGSPFRVHRHDYAQEYISALSVGASVKHSNDNEVFWSVDICWDNDQWSISSSIEIDRDGVIETVKVFESTTADTLAECVSAITAACERLRSHPEAFALLSG